MSTPTKTNTESVLIDKNSEVKNTSVETNNSTEIPEEKKEEDSTKNADDATSKNENTPAESPPTKEEEKDEEDKEEQEEKEDSNAKSTEDSTNNTSSFNPDLPDGEENKEMLNRLRGDAIGSTMYSERFVISILLKLRAIKEPLDKNKKLEKELESLWDMTIEHDVVLMLLQLEVFDIFTQCIINYSNDVRLIEILIGIIGNMCSVVEPAMLQLSKNEIVMQMILQLINSSDSCILIQLMRLLATVYTKKVAVIAWNKQIRQIEGFVDGLAFILNCSNNSSLLSHALETLNAILAKCAYLEDSKTEEGSTNNEDNSGEENETEREGEGFLEFFVSKSLIDSSLEAFRTLHGKETVNDENIDDGDFDSYEVMSEEFKKAIILFLNIHDIFLNYTPTPYDNNCEHSLELCLSIILQAIETPKFVLFSNIDYLQNILECIGEIYLARPNLHSEDHTFYVIKIWELIDKKVVGPTNGASTSNDFENDNYENELVEDSNELCYLTEELLRMLLQRCEKETYANIFRRCNPEVATKIFELYGVEIVQYDEMNMDAYCAELETALHGIKDGS